MNQDIYAEWLVKRKDPWWKIPLILLYILLFGGGIALSTFFSFGFIAPVILAIVGFLGYRYLSVEYEYVFVSGELSIDIIYNQNARKAGKVIQMEDIEYVEKTDPEKNARLLAGREVKLLDYSSQMSESTYTISCRIKGERCLVLFEPNDTLLKAMWRMAPGKIKDRP